MNKNRRRSREHVGKRRYAVVIALAFFTFLAGLPKVLSELHVSIYTAPPSTSYGIHLLGAPPAPRLAALPPTARPVNAARPTAKFPPVNDSQEVAAVATEDGRLRALLRDSFSTFQPRLVRYHDAPPTLLLPSGTHTVFTGSTSLVATGQSQYTAADLIRLGALRVLPNGAALLQESVFVADGAQLSISTGVANQIYLANISQGPVSIVSWGGQLSFFGSRRNPLNVEGRDETTLTPATDHGSGRPYIRTVGGKMTFNNVRVSNLGFWSGRTGGVAWTGLSTQYSLGGATATTFTGNTYGAFVSRGKNVAFQADLFEANQLDGLHVHRGTLGASATLSAAVRNGANGFHVGRSANGTVLKNDVAEHNATNGFLADGRPLVSTPSASGAAVVPSTGTVIEDSEALHNGRTGILIEGGNRPVLTGNEVCARLTAIAVRLRATHAVVSGNDVRCRPRTGISIGPAAPGAVLSGNAVSGARIAVLVSSAGGTVEINNGLVTGARVFGISVRGVNSTVIGKDNVLSGTGFRALDSRADASVPRLSGTDDANWSYLHKGTLWSYLRFHPLALMWLSIALLVTAGGLWVRRRRAPSHPYPESTRWRAPAAAAEPVPVPLASHSGAHLKVIPAPGHALVRERAHHDSVEETIPLPLWRELR
ncbi:MAG: right-handed parallel beta-helix repeat-containing protein [Actinobacteria bacterium]|nr:right-handed parallel beta-helix repeat-containing protein [Actinomycetota bacterium]